MLLDRTDRYQLTIFADIVTVSLKSDRVTLETVFEEFRMSV